MNEFEEKLRTIDNDDCYVWAQKESTVKHSGKPKNEIYKELRDKIINYLNLAHKKL